MGQFAPARGQPHRKRHSGRARALAALLATVLSAAAPSAAQFLDTFAGRALRTDAEALEGWSFFTGDGEATMDMRLDGDGHASILVDATQDRYGIWWALIKRRVSEALDLEQLVRPGYELRIEARIRVSHAPRRVNLHLNTQRTTDYHSHLMEFDIPEKDVWHTISMTTHGFDARPTDTVFGQLALMDWGHERYRVDLDYFKVEVVNATRSGPDVGEQVPYHPPIPDPRVFSRAVGAAQEAVVDSEFPDFNFHGWSALAGDHRVRLLTVSGTQTVILRFDLRPFSGRQVATHGLLELTTHSVQRAPAELEELGKIRLFEILGGDPEWRAESVTLDSYCAGQPLATVLNGQMIIDEAVAEVPGARTYLTISRPVLQRLIDGRTSGIALQPLGAVVASFHSGVHADGHHGPRLLFDLVQ